MITRKELSEARRDGNGSVHGWFWAYCKLNSSCETCNRYVRLLCRIKCAITGLQEKIILHICKEEHHA